MKPIHPIFIVIISTLLLTFLFGIFLEVARGCIRIPSSIWLYSLAASAVFIPAHYWLERKGKVDILLSNKEHSVLKLLLGAFVVAIAYFYSLPAAALLLIICGVASIADYAYRYSHFSQKTNRRT